MSKDSTTGWLPMEPYPSPPSHPAKPKNEPPHKELTTPSTSDLRKALIDYPLLPCTVCGAMADRDAGRVATVRQTKLVSILQELARQKLPCELDPEDQEGADYMGAYEAMVHIARGALE